MKRCRKLLTALILSSISVVSISTPAFANTNTSSYVYDANTPIPGTTVDNDFMGGSITPNVWWPATYEITSKTLIGSVRHITKYITPNWSMADHYTLQKGESTTYSLKIGLSGDFAKAVKASGDFNYSKTFSATVTTSIPADPSRNSKLTYQCDYNRYSVTVYKRPGYDDEHDTVPAPPKKYVGTDIVDEPTDATYAVVVYK